VTDHRLSELLATLERERVEADRRYNDALTALDRATGASPAPMPGAPTPYDASQLAVLNDTWAVAATDPPGITGSFKGRLRRFVWHVVGPLFGAQQRFNATLVDHLNRNTRAHEESRDAATAALDAARESLARLAQFQALLVQLLQTVTLYVDTKDRSIGGQLRVLAAGLSAVSDDGLKRWESLAAREQRFHARIADLDDVRATAVLAQQTALTLKREVERLLDAGVTATSRPTGTQPPAAEPVASADLEAFKYLGFEDAFRGSQDEIRSRLADYLPRFEGRSDIVDLGCGRGEFLTLLRDHGISGRGVDLNHEMVEIARGRGLDVTESDALGFLSAQADESLGGVFAAQVVEHLDPAYLGRLLETSLHKLRPGGIIVLETINVACWSAFFESYLRDLTHVKALHPDTLQYLVRASGFQRVEVEFRAPISQDVALSAAPSAPDSPALSELVEAFNENARKLNQRLFTHQDYAVIGWK
jgi:O-antigen chain-terminating methyltransferase